MRHDGELAGAASYHLTIASHRRLSTTRMPHYQNIRFLALLLVATACSRATESRERETLYQAESVLTVRIVNRSQLDATIYLVHDGTRDRLGTVTAASSASFSVRARTLGSGEFTLLADPVGLRLTATSETLRVAEGSEFTWTLESDFSRGAVLVRD